MSDSNDKPFPERPEGADPDVLEGAFRETFLSRIFRDDGPDVNAFRSFGKFLNGLSLEHCGAWPYRNIDETANGLRAGVGDLRHLEEHFTYWGDKEPAPEEEPDEVKRHRELWRLSMRAARRLKKLADEIEKEVRDWEFKPRSS